MRRLVALDLPGGPTFVDALRRAFDAGDAIWPVDPRLPAPARERLTSVLRPAIAVTLDGEVALDDGVPIEDGDAVVVATSGTTGEPRGVVLTHAAVAASAEATSARLGIDPTQDRWLCCLPLAHVGGLSVVLRALATDTSLEVHAGFDPAAVADAARSGATRVSLVPTMLRRLGPLANGFATVLLGGAAPPRALAPNVVVTYGLTESGSGVVYDGRPLEGVEVVLGTEDEIRLRAPMLLRAYRDGTDPKDAAGWFATGDIGRIDPDDRLRVLGRRDDVIVTGGENVWPDAVEAVLARHLAPTEVVVAGVPDEEWGERVVAFVVAGNRSVGLDELRAVVRDELGAPAAPRELVVVDSLPRTASGKVQRRALAKAHAGS